MPYTLYFSPGACSFSPHVALRESGLPFVLERVDLRTKKTASGEDFLAINPKGYVPALKLPNGELLTEGPAIVQWVADQAPEKGLAFAPGSFERARVQEWLTYVGTELHKTFSPLFDRAASEEVKASAKNRIGARFAYVAQHLEGRTYLVGERFTVADGYLYTVLSWTAFVGIDLAAWPALEAFRARIHERPSVQEARAAEHPKA
jgi:glutathione S-transferase